MPKVIETEAFATWLSALKDSVAKTRIVARIKRLAAGSPGDVKPVGDGVSELRFRFGPGYRVYFAKRGEELIIILGGGDKDTQARDIKAALKLWGEVKKEDSK
ncbi:type II toxin-antitoxin system RelE/ParE family toxin [Terricaulis silvestris]|uniref:Putative addiction module killer protein n=1 Tax=Terricaulis silvestris TaxID=2686094 RepID=A0A6I6MJZ4_9CAUL|nr:type II toxin-antitoxin system RelE/ParE family toxin [Terricaulis silvestris]QGZ95530.1 putative addiction module killer protein [Terricaulis silvestris]